MKPTRDLLTTSTSRRAFAFAAFLTILGGVRWPSLLQAKEPGPAKPTVVMVHGAFAGSSSWNPVISRLLAKGYPVVAIANPLRGLGSDSKYLSAVMGGIAGPIILVGHSYGGMVISNAATGNSKVKALVYVSGLAPEAGETASALVAKLPGSTLGPTLAPPVVLPGGAKELYILQGNYNAQFCADVPAADAGLMAATQRPIIEAAFNEAAGAPAWKTIPSWFLYGSLDKNIPAAVHAFMSRRAGAKKVVEVKGASHVVMISHPDALVRLIDDAATTSLAAN